MQRTSNKVRAVITLSVLMMALGGCKKEEGPAEKAGKEIDKAVSDAGKQLESIGKEIQGNVR